MGICVLGLVSLLWWPAPAACPLASLHKDLDPATAYGGPTGRRLQSDGLPLASMPTTLQGCSCKGACSADGDLWNKCDWCYTEDSCGEYSFLRWAYWDYCVYPTDVSWDTNTWDHKHDVLWDRVVDNGGNGKYPSAIEIVNLLISSIQPSFDTQWDVMPEGRIKYIHSVGVVCQVDMQVDSGSPYTGILRSGSAKGLIRLSSAAEVSDTGAHSPGFGLKFLRSYARSANVFAMPSLDGQESPNFFQNAFHMHVEPTSKFILAQLAKKFEQASTCPTMTGLSDVARYAQDGEFTGDPRFPFKLVFRPTGDLMTDATGGTEAFLKSTEAISTGSTLFKVYAVSRPGAEEELLGALATTSECRRSKFGDEQLFFRHQRIEEDWELRPEWLATIESSADCGTGQASVKPPDTCVGDLLHDQWIMGQGLCSLGWSQRPGASEKARCEDMPGCCYLALDQVSACGYCEQGSSGSKDPVEECGFPGWLAKTKNVGESFKQVANACECETVCGDIWSFQESQGRCQCYGDGTIKAKKNSKYTSSHKAWF